MPRDSRPKPKANIYRGALWENTHKKKPDSPASNKGACRIKDICQTCRYVNQNYEQGLKEKYEAGLELLRQQNLLKGTNIIPPALSERPFGYRTHAKLAVRAPEKCVNPEPNRRFSLGLFRPESHDVVELSRCPLHKQSINHLVKDLKDALDASELTPYDEASNTGDLRYLAIRASHLTDELMVTFVMTNDKYRIPMRNMVNELREKGHKINSAHININAEPTNTIFGEESRRIAGTDRLRERLCDFDFEIGPTSFFQVNPWQAEIIYRRIDQLAGQRVAGDVAWDLYCGTGQISLLLAKTGYRVLGIEANPQAIRDAQNNAVRNHIENPPHFMAGKVEELQNQLPSWAETPKLIVVNPARKGLAEPVRALLRQVLQNNPGTRLIYMSCEVGTLTRDLKDILQEDIPLRQLEAFDMFPHTEKMEWLAIVN